MMRPFHFAFALATGMLTAAVFAQPAPKTPVALSNGGDVTMPEEDQTGQDAPRTLVTEKREKGQVTGAIVSRGDNTYHLKPNTQVGSAQSGDAQSTGNRAAQWQVLQFDWQRQPEKARHAAPPPATPQD